MDAWTDEIVKAVIVRQRLGELDTNGLYQYPLPEVAASDDEIASTEATLGYELDPQYRAFLRHANGWASLLQAIDLFGTRQLLGAAPMDAARDQLAAIDPDDFEVDAGCPIDDLLPIGASTVQADLWLLAKPSSRYAGQVLWTAGAVVDRFPGFDELFLSMVDYNRAQIAYFERQQG